jgi:hypothetical protein
MTAVLLVSLPLPAAAMPVGAVVILSVLGRGLWRCTRRGVPALLHIGIDRSIRVTDIMDRSSRGSILDDSYVGAWLTTIVWCADDDPWWYPARTMLVVPDMLGQDEFRRLRVLLRYGRPAIADPASDVEAG